MLFLFCDFTNFANFENLEKSLYKSDEICYDI